MPTMYGIGASTNSIKAFGNIGINTCCQEKGYTIAASAFAHEVSLLILDERKMIFFSSSKHSNKCNTSDAGRHLNNSSNDTYPRVNRKSERKH